MEYRTHPGKLLLCVLVRFFTFFFYGFLILALLQLLRGILPFLGFLFFVGFPALCLWPAGLSLVLALWDILVRQNYLFRLEGDSLLVLRPFRPPCAISLYHHSFYFVRDGLLETLNSKIQKPYFVRILDTYGYCREYRVIAFSSSTFTSMALAIQMAETERNGLC